MKKRTVLIVGFLWAALCCGAWFGPPKEISNAERRKLAQFPTVSVKNVVNGKFMSDFETYTQDQFPLRDGFRQLKSLFHYYLAGQKDNNGIYLAGDYAVKLEYPMNEDSVSHAASRFSYLYKTYLQDAGCKSYLAIVPDKAYYLADEAGAPRLDYEAMFSAMGQAMPWAEPIDLTDVLSADCYYRTDIHWRQEKIQSAAEKICQQMQTALPGSYTQKAVDVPFYGVYYGQAALPMRAETMYYMDSDLLTHCTVYNWENNTYGDVYDMTKLTSKDLYDVFLSGSVSLLTIENPDGDPDRELIIFRDSFGSSIAPYLVQGYSKITMVDIRYLFSHMLGKFIDFHGQDVLFLYSTSVLNNSNTLK